MGLTYKNNPSYNTPIGGVFTMIAFFIFMTWLALETIDVYMPPGKHSVSSSEVITQKADGSWPLESLKEEQFFVAFKLRIDEAQATKVDPAQLEKYYSAIYLQRKNGVPISYFKAVPCKSLYSEYDVLPMFYQQLDGYMCPDAMDSTVLIQNASPANPNGDSYDFFFVLDTCEHMQKLTGEKCASESDSQDDMDFVYVDTKIQTQFWNTKNFLRSGFHMNPQFVSAEVQLNSAVFQRQAYSLIPNSVTMRNNRWINVPYMPKVQPGEKYRAFDVTSAFNTVYPVLDKDELPDRAEDVNPQDTYFSMKFTQSSKSKSTSSSREAVSNTFQRFGSYLALCLRFIGYLLGAYQRFSLDNSMTKKLYNYVEEAKHEEGSDDP